MPGAHKPAARPRRKTSSRTARSAAPSIASTAVVVKDRRKALAWYTEVLGLVPLMEEGHWVTVGKRGQGGALHLCQVTEFDPKGKLEPGNTGILLLIEGDFSARCEELRARGVEICDGPTQRPWGWDATIRDPDGNELLLMPTG